MQSSVALLVAASASMGAAWSITAYSDAHCTDSTGFHLGQEGTIGCVGISSNETIKSIGVTDMSNDLIFQGSSGFSCNNFHQTGGNGCYTQGQNFQSFTVNQK